MAVQLILDSKKVQVKWNVETRVVDVICENKLLASRYLVSLINSKRLGTITAIVFQTEEGLAVVELYAGRQRVLEFLGMAHAEPKYKPRRRLRDLIQD